MPPKDLLTKLRVRTNRRRALFFLIIDILLLALSMWTAFLIRFEGQIPSRHIENLWIIILVSLALKVPIFYLQRLYHISWSYVSLRELMAVFKGSFYSSLLLGTALFILRAVPPLIGFPRSVLFIDFFLTVTLIGGFRVAKRVYLQFVKGIPVGSRRTLIVGAGDAGEQLVRSILKSGHTNCLPVGFVDDDPAKRGTFIQGVKVLGTREDIPRLVAGYDVEELLIAIPSGSSQIIKETVKLGREAKVKTLKILPDISEILSGSVGLADVREVQLADLLGREPVRINTQAIEGYLEGKAVLVTGAAGSIGSELCRQIIKFQPRKLIMLDHEETGLFTIEREIAEKFPATKSTAVLGDIKDKRKMERLFIQHKLEIVFHAAAYKHVRMMKDHPDEAVQNNILGTKVLGEASINAKVKRFILISTDKAVNPVGIMGMSKRVAELVVQDLNQQQVTRFSAVRFGNVLGSRGSVIPIFEAQIKRRGPVTVTDSRMTRYFMMPAEAVLLVLQAGAMSEGGEIFVLDMGEPVNILELARAMIRLSGYEPDKDIPISITRSGEDEKLCEDILTAEEGTEATQHEQIFIAKMNTRLCSAELARYLEFLKKLVAQASNAGKIREVLREAVDRSYASKVKQS